LLAWLSIIIVGFGLGGCSNERSNEAAADADSFVPFVMAQTEAIISLQPPTQTITVGSTTVIEIRVENVANLFGAQIELQFDPGVLQVVDSAPNQDGAQIQPGPFLSPDLVQINQADNGTGNIFYTVAQLAPTPPANGTGALAFINFLAKTAGTSQITFNVVKLSDPDGQNIPTLAQAAQILVAAPGTGPTATFTPTATATPQTAPVTDTPTTTPTTTATAIPIPTATATTLPPPPPPDLPPPPPPMERPPEKEMPKMAHIPKGSTFGFCYRVLLGETIYDVANKFNIPPDTINLVNDLYPPNVILAYQALFIPRKKGRGPNVYVVREGDTLQSIADGCKLTPSMIAKANNLWPSPLELSVTPAAARQNPTLEAGLPLIIPIPPFPPPSRYPWPLPIEIYPPSPCCEGAPGYQVPKPQPK
jgi:hypothetical protein